jgi:hypothetical protein
MARFIGIDPGAKGYFCLLDTATKDVSFMANPPTNLSIKIWQWLKLTDDLKQIHMIGLEHVHSIHGTSAKSNFSFGQNVGAVMVIAELSQIGYELVQPKAWQKACGITFKKGMSPAEKKKHIAATAQRIYPNVSLYGPKGGLLDGKADALMIAHYLSIKYGINP